MSVRLTITQADVAKACGLSRTAVAYALNPLLQSQLPLKTRQRVLESARQLGYRPHRHAQLMRGKNSGLIGIIKTTGIVQTGVERSFFASQAIQAAGYGLVVNEIHWDEAGAQRAVNVMLDARVEGVLLAGLASIDGAALEELRRLQIARIPLAAIGSARADGIPSVMTDYRQGMAELTRHLLALGYRKLTLVCPVRAEEFAWPQNWGFAERMAGFRETVAAAGLSADEARVLHQPHTTGWADDYAPGQAAIQQLVARGERPEVLLCSNDEVAIGAMDACAEMGWRVPEDIAITGFDNSTIGRYARPRLTSVTQPTEATGKKVVELLLKQMRGEKLSASEKLVKLPCQVVVRQSCGNNQKQRRVV